MPLLGPLLHRARLTLFWRTFLSLVLLLAVCLVAWVRTFVSLEFEPQAVQSARQVASLVNLTRVALQHTDAIARISLIKTLDDEERLHIAPREPGDTFTGYGNNPFTQHLAATLIETLGAGTIVASEVNGTEGLWVAFAIGADTYWMLLDPHRVASIHNRTWLIWLSIAAASSLAGAALIARLINRPLQALAAAATRLRSGRFDGAPLDETVATTEIRDVNVAFNRMVSQLEQAERDRSLMLAGISHDLRTPLARLRLEAEMSVPDEQARNDMVADMSQVEAIINKFMDYARPGAVQTQPIELAPVLDALHQLQVVSTGRVVLRMSPPSPALAGCCVLADPVDLQRVLQNLLENAARYGQTPSQSVAEVDVACEADGPHVRITVRDHGPGVPDAVLNRLTEPFFRADEARTQAMGSGLGLSIVEKLLQRMGGQLRLAHGAPGLKVQLWLRAARPAGVPR